MQEKFESTAAVDSKESGPLNLRYVGAGCSEWWPSAGESAVLLDGEAAVSLRI